MSTRGFDRREFVRAAAGLAALPVFGRLPLTDRSTNPDGLGGFAGAPRHRVALVATSDRKRGVTELFSLLDPRGIDGRRVVLKPNFNSSDEAPASTHNDTLKQLVAELHERGARSITLGESSGPPATRGVMERKGIFDLAHDSQFGVVNFEEIADDEWVFIPPVGTHWPEGFHLPRLVVDSEYLVTTCCLKTHGYGGVFTMSLKLSVGLTPKPVRRTMHRSPDMRRMIAELNAAYRPQLVVLDGVTAFTDGGPSQGTLKAANVMLAGYDRVAIDAVGLAVLKAIGSNAAIMDRRIFDQEQMARAAQLGLGARSSGEIELVTASAESAAYAARLRPILDLG